MANMSRKTILASNEAVAAIHFCNIENGTTLNKVRDYYG